MARVTHARALARHAATEVALALWALVSGTVLLLPGATIPPGSILAGPPEWLWACLLYGIGVMLLVGVLGWRDPLRRAAAFALFLIAFAGLLGIWMVMPGSPLVPACAIPTFLSALVYDALR